MEVDELPEDFDEREDESDEASENSEEDIKEPVEKKPKKSVSFNEKVKVAKWDTQSTTSQSFSVASSDLNEEAFSSDEGSGSDTEIHEAIFGEDSDEDEQTLQNDSSEESGSDISAEDGMYDSDEENEILEKLMNEGKPVKEASPEPESSSEEPPVNPDQVFPSVELSEAEKMASLPKSELEESTASQGGKYVPPAMRGQNNALERSVRGFLNRLSGANLYAISQEFVKIYRANSRKEVSKYLVKSIFAQILLPVAAPQLLQEDYSCLIIVLNKLVSEDVSFFIVEEIILRYFQLEAKLEPSYEDEMPKTLQNLLSLVCSLTRLKLFQSKLLYEILDRLIKRFDLSCVELVRSIFNESAFALRKDDPGRLKTTIQAIHNQAKEKQAELEEKGGSRIKFMLEMLTAVKNNNVNEMKKSPGFIDFERDEGCKKRIRGVLGQVQLEPIPAVALSDVLNIAQLGRWWRVGAAVVVKRNNQESNEKVEKAQEVSTVLQAKAKKMGMNTDNKVWSTYT